MTVKQTLYKKARHFTHSLCISAPLIFGITFVPEIVEEPTIKEVYPDEYAQFVFQITAIDGNNYYGIDEEGERIYFTGDYITDGTVSVGDIVYAIFEADNTVDGLVAIKTNKEGF